MLKYWALGAALVCAVALACVAVWRYGARAGADQVAAARGPDAGDFRPALESALRRDPVTPALEDHQREDFVNFCGQMLEAYSQPAWDDYVLLMQSLGGALRDPSLKDRLAKHWGPTGLSFPWAAIDADSLRIEPIRRLSDGAVITPGDRARPILHVESKFDFGVDRLKLGKAADRALCFRAVDQRGFEHNVWIILGWDEDRNRWIPLWLWADDPPGEWTSPVIF